jgi:hypothetical protein
VQFCRLEQPSRSVAGNSAGNSGRRISNSLNVFGYFAESEAYSRQAFLITYNTFLKSSIVYDSAMIWRIGGPQFYACLYKECVSIGLQEPGCPIDAAAFF